MRQLLRLLGIAASVGLTGKAGAIFLAGFAFGHICKTKAKAETQVETNGHSAKGKTEGTPGGELGCPLAPCRSSLSSSWHKEESPCTSDAGSENSDVKSTIRENYRMVLIVRMDLKMSKQKIGSLLCHAALGQFKKLHKTKNTNLWEWEHDGRSTVILRARDEGGLTDLKASAKAQGVPTHIIIDRSSANNSPVRSVMAVGPAKSNTVSALTKHLTLW